MRDWDQTESAITLYNEILELLDRGYTDEAVTPTATTTAKTKPNSNNEEGKEEKEEEGGSAEASLSARLQKADVRFNLGGVLRESGDHVAAIAEYNEGLRALGIRLQEEDGEDDGQDDDSDDGDDDDDGDGGVVDVGDAGDNDETTAAIAARVGASHAQLLMARGLSTAKLGQPEDVERGLRDLEASSALQPRATTHNAIGAFESTASLIFPQF
eukprot:COSAG06_NODE_291_length_18216_cov_13.929514_10_plen_214_part_00